MLFIEYSKVEISEAFKEFLHFVSIYNTNIFKLKVYNVTLKPNDSVKTLFS